MRSIYQKFSQNLNSIAKELYPQELSGVLWEFPKDNKFGDISTMLALKLAKKLKKNPLEIAETIKKKIEQSMGDEISRVDVLKPGFVNVFISKSGLADAVNSIVSEGESFFKEKRERKVLIEFVSANPTGPLSIAHGRQAVVGDAIARILEFFGNDIDREYYVNDEGRQIELLVESVQSRIKEIKKEDTSFPEDGYKGEYIKDVAQTALDKKIELDDLSVRKFSLNFLLGKIKDVLMRLNIEFNSWFSQKELIDRGEVEDTIKFLDQKNLLCEKEQALWFLSTKFGDDKDRVLKKSDGLLTYFASDVAYHKDKIDRGYDMLINLWGPDHHGYIKRVKSSIKAMGFNENILNILIIQLVTLSTKEKMSKRKGNAILLADLIDEVGVDATRFYYLLRKNSSQLEFDIDLAKTLSFDNPLYYVQYAHARICSIFKKAGSFNLSSINKELLDDNDIILIRSMLGFISALDKAYYSYEPVFIIEYLRTLAASFHRFYENAKVLTDDEHLTNNRLIVLKAARTVLACGLNILGICAVEEM